jgi:hypothetical protein
MAKPDLRTELAQATRLLRQIHERAKAGLGSDPRLSDEWLRDIARWTLPYSGEPAAEDSNPPPPPLPPDGPPDPQP